MTNGSEKKERTSLFYPQSTVRGLENDLDLLRENVDKCDGPMTMELIRRIDRNPTVTIDDSVTVSMMIQRFKLNCRCEPQSEDLKEQK